MESMSEVVDSVAADERGDLPEHLERLFLYCSLFPFDYEFRKRELVWLWIAEGFIIERQGVTMEDTASEHFSSLEKKGFFVFSRCDYTTDYDPVPLFPTDHDPGNFLYTVNPIKHSLLKEAISSGIYFRAVDGNFDGASEMTRHLSLIGEDTKGMAFSILQKFKQLQTLHLLSGYGSSMKHVPRYFCFTLKFLTTLNLSGTLISELPSSIGNVKSLRYVDASRTPIARLPESIDSLHNLQTIKLRGCLNFVQLPKAMRKLTKLRHIDLDIIRQLESLPAHLGDLSDLQTLPAFFVGRDDGCHVTELKNLNGLKGAVTISRIENVFSEDEAEEAALVHKKRIHRLELRWSDMCIEEAKLQEKVLECLQPHFGLKELQIQQYSGSKLPTWISNPSFAHLDVITLYRCKHCKVLPCMGQLPALRSLSMIEVNEVKEINHQFHRTADSVDHAFMKLERLEVDMMLNLKGWEGVALGDFPSLVTFIVDSCPELDTLPALSRLERLKHLELKRCSKLMSFPSDGLPASLESLLIMDCLRLKEWSVRSDHWNMSFEQYHEGWSMLRVIDLSGSKYLRSTPDFSMVPNLRKLDLQDCTSLVEVHPSLGCLKKLVSLNMKNCKSVESIPPFTNLESLQTLTLSLCSSLKKFPEIKGDMKSLLRFYLDETSFEEFPNSVVCLTGLTSLNLRNCKNLLRLPSAIRCLAYLKEIIVAGCSKINGIPDDMDILERLLIGGTSIRDLSFVLGMKNLKYLSCQGCKGLASESGKGLRPLWSLTGLIELDLSDCSLMDGAIPDDLSSLISLKTFNLSGNGFVALPESISQLSMLVTLVLSNCRELQLVPKLPSRVRFVHAEDCDSLRDFPNQCEILASPDLGVTVISSLDSAGSTVLGETEIYQVKQRPATPQTPSMTSQTDIPSSFYPPPHRKLTYDVFLSFYGEDIRYNFTDHLYTALKQKGIITYRDERDLPRGEPISPILLEAIEESRYVIVIFSKKYATSSWCLDEVAKVADCMKAKKQKVFPVFYHVDPSEVRKQTGDYFGKAFEKHQERFDADKVHRWRDALYQVGNLSGLHIKDGYESKYIQEIVQLIFTEFIQIIPTSAEGLVGMDSHLKEMLSFLDIGCPDVRILGICGMGGIGKTIIAKVLYDRIQPHFEGHCFLVNVREVTEMIGVDHLQEILLSELLKTDVKVESRKMGKDMIRHRLSSKKVLIILDDVDQFDQLEALCHRTWFGPGSRIIITSRDVHLLNLSEADQVYKVSPLSDAEALKLFSQKASKGDQLVGDFLKLSKEFLEYADGLPLAISVLGSSVCGRNVKVWSSVLNSLKTTPDKRIIDVLKWSFYGLEESEKRIFLDIACFFKGMSFDRVRRILQGSNADCPDIGIQVLLDKSMITQSGKKLSMHKMMQELGGAIVQESNIKPGRRSRLWRSKEIIGILDQSKATSAVQSISLRGPTNDGVVHSLNDSFSDMDNLRLLSIKDVKFSGNIKYLSNELQYLEWHECPLDSFPSDFQPDKLVELHMHSSRIQQLWRGEKGWSMLRLIDLRGSKDLRLTPDFSEVQHLESLNLEDCTSLVKIHSSLGCLKKLDSLNMKNCKSVESLPPFTSLGSLESLNLTNCSRLKFFPEITGNMKNLLELSLDGTSFEELPNSVASLTGLTSLNLRYCKNLMSLPSAIRCLTSLKHLVLAGCSKINDIPELTSVENLNIDGTAIRDLLFISAMKNLKYLSCQGCTGLASESYRGLRPLWSLTGLVKLVLSDCSLMDGSIPDDLSSLNSLTTFDLSGNSFVRLSEGISQLSKLKTLHLSNCTKLQFIPKLPSSVRWVYFPNQVKLLTSPDSGFTIINSLNSDDSSLGKTLAERIESSPLHGRIVHSLGKVDNIEWKQIVDNVSSGKVFERSLPTVANTGVFPADEIPEWFSTKSEGSRISIPIPPNLMYDDKCHGVALCAVFSENERYRSAISIVHPGSEISQQFQCTLTTGLYPMKPAFTGCDVERFRPFSHLLSVFYIPKSEFPHMSSFSNMMLATFETSHPSSWEMQTCGIRLVYEQDAGWFANLFPQMECTLLHEVYSAIQNSGWLSRVDRCWKWEPCTPPGKVDSTTYLQRKNMESVLPRYFEAANVAVFFKFTLSGCPGWCMKAFDDGPLCSPLSILLPRNLYKCKKWMGIVAYASITEKEPHTSEEEYRVYLGLSIGEYRINLSTTYVNCTSLGEPHQLLFVYIPRAAIIQEFTQTSQTILRMAFSTDRPGNEVQRRGIKIVYKQEGLQEFVEAINHCVERVNADIVASYNKWVVEKWIELLRVKGDSCTPNKHFSRTRREKKFEMLSRKYVKWDWYAYGFCCHFFGAEFCRQKWYMCFNEGNTAEIQLPPNLLDDSSWLGISVCAIHWKSHEDQNIILDTPALDNNVLSWYLEFDVAWDRLCTFKHELLLQKLSPELPEADWTLYKYVPQTQLRLRRQCRTAKVTFWSSSPCLGMRSCALRLVYKDDIEDLVQSLTLCELP